MTERKKVTQFWVEGNKETGRKSVFLYETEGHITLIEGDTVELVHAFTVVGKKNLKIHQEKEILQIAVEPIG